MLNNVLKTIRKYDMNLSGTVVCGFSGGADSLCLVHILKKLGIPLLCVHVNHNLRGGESIRDENFCLSFCEKEDIPLKIISLSLNGKSEEAARNARYEALQNVAAGKAIALAHNADDNAETVLFNLIRGCALNGLCGIKPVRENIIRPLIECTKNDILKYAQANNLCFVTDSTNFSNDYTRNFIRNEILPKIKEINPKFVENTSVLTNLLTKDNNFLETLSNNCVEPIIDLDYALKSRIIQKKYKQAAGTHYNLSSKYVNEIIKILPKQKCKIDLPCKVTAFVENSELSFEKKAKDYLHKRKAANTND